MSWEDQGRQDHGWFGHGTAPDKGKQTAPDPSVLGQSEADRALALAYGALGALLPAQRRQVEAQYHNGTLPRLKEALTAWLRATALDQASFGSRLFGRGADDPVVRDLHRAASRAANAESHDDLRDAAERLAQAMQGVGIDRWPGFVADAAERARDPATRAAIEKSKQPPSPGRDAIRPVYPVETAIGVAAAGLAGGAAAAARALAGAGLRQILPKSQSMAGNAGAVKTEGNSTPPAANRAEFQNYTDGLRRNMGRPATADPKLSGIMDEMYRPNAKIGSGSTADAVRSERATGQPTGGAWHTKKAEESVIRLQRWLQANPTASPGDRAAAENVIRDLQNALAGK